MKIKYKIQKKGFTPMEVIIGIIITIISFYLILSFFVSNKDIVGSYAQDLQCRATIEAKSTTTVDVATEVSKRAGIDSFLSVLNNKCSVDYLTIKSNKKDEIFKKIADEEARCYYRYGEGEKEFLSSFKTTGNWCFVCGVVNIESNEKQKYEYSEYIDWINKKEYKKENGKSIKYGDYLNTIYSEELTVDEANNLSAELNEILKEQDPATQSFAQITLEQYQSYQDLRLKKISTEEDIYVVYRYDRIDKEFSDKMISASIDAGIGLGVGIAIGTLLETAVWGVGTTAVCSAAVVTAPTVVGGAFFGTLCAAGTAKTIQTVTSATYKTTLSVSKITKLTNLMNKISSKVKFTKKGKQLAELNRIQKYGTTEDLVKFTAGLRNDKKYESLVSSLDKNIVILNKHNIKNLDDLPKAIGNNQAELLELKKVIKESNEIVEKDLAKGLKAVTQKNIKELESIDLTHPDASVKMTDVLRSTLPLMGAASGANIGYNSNSQSEQYVDIMTKEQYFRLCGTERRIDERMKAQK